MRSPALKDERNPDQLSQVFEKDAHLAHLWNEYRKTLYDAMPTSGGVVAPQWRSTVAAENFWNGQLVVESRVHAEFFKHVPGIFTGLGIIGTFLGLIEGLRNFKVSALTQGGDAATQDSVAQTAQKSLESLMHSVGDAFLISAAAISLAMLATFLEKLLLNSLYAKVDYIAQLLDDKFAAASAEKFLEQTASYTEESATQLKQLKGELIKDLTPILHELSDKQSKMLERLAGSFQERMSEASHNQIEASRDNTTAMADTISGAITNGLSGPLEEIKAAVKQASGDQSATAIKMLQDVMVSFSQKLNDLFGGQINGINELNHKTAETMQNAVTKLNELVANLQEAGRSSSASMGEQMARALSDMEARQAAITQSTQQLVAELKLAIEQSHTATSAGVQNSSDEMARRMAESIEKMEQRQDSINERTREFVEQIKAVVSSSQNETGTKVQSTLQAIGDQVGDMLNQFQAAQQAALATGQQREADNASKTESAVAALAARSQTFVDEVGQLLSRSQAATDAGVRSTMQALGGQVGSMLQEFQGAQQSALESGRQREEQNAQKTQELVSAMVGSVESLVQQIAQASARMQESVAALTTTTTSAISRLSDGADQVNSAARNFAAASDKAAGTIHQVSSVTGQLSDLTTHLTASSTALQQGIQDYRSHREAVAAMVAELNGLVNNAKSDVSITSNVLQRIEQASDKLASAHFETEKFMMGVATVLAKAHEEFRVSVTTSLGKANHEFQQKLSAAVGMLGSSIKELDDVLVTATPKKKAIA
ncbi:anti-phage ZorAB system protein ZorA [Polaromonas naphthalenivorans]|uniref:anti-phage ZorAB system protein ZorA n=1 Tax=Polaromonas naphthalenivorans TaxID=216465 RepID=UPI00030E8722|nr:anti-phage ZorAB system protein ZorA [Polaromonas naphthalenivorans]